MSKQYMQNTFKHLQKSKKQNCTPDGSKNAKKNIQKPKKTAHPIGASLLFDSLAMGVADLCFFGGVVWILAIWKQKCKKPSKKKKKLHTSTIHLFRLQALHCTDIFFVMFWLLIFRGLTRVV